MNDDDEERRRFAIGHIFKIKIKVFVFCGDCHVCVVCKLGDKKITITSTGHTYTGASYGCSTMNERTNVRVPVGDDQFWLLMN